LNATKLRTTVAVSFTIIPSLSSSTGPNSLLLSFPTRRSPDLGTHAPLFDHAQEPRLNRRRDRAQLVEKNRPAARAHERAGAFVRDRKSTRLNSSHVKISYAVFCLKKKKM